jgi:hypothetical protein
MYNPFCSPKSLPKRYAGLKNSSSSFTRGLERYELDLLRALATANPAREGFRFIYTITDGFERCGTSG